MRAALPGHAITVYETTDSTNTRLRALENTPDGAVICARGQSAGRGRHGKSFSSPTGAGVYFSTGVCRNIPKERAWAMTFFAAAAVARTLESFSLEAQIKWVNDIYVGSRKVCGILTEIELDGDLVRRAVIGIGINLRKTELPPEVAARATSLEEQGVIADETQTVARTVRELYRLTDAYDIPGVIDEYRRRDMLLGREITYERDGRLFTGKAAGIEDDGSLAVISDGQRLSLGSGMVSIKI